MVSSGRICVRPTEVGLKTCMPLFVVLFYAMSSHLAVSRHLSPPHALTVRRAVAVVAGAYMHWLAVLLLLEWRDASGGCAAPMFDGPAASASANMRLLGQDVMHFDQVWAQLRAYAAEHLMALPGHTHAPGDGGFAHATACAAPGTDTCPA